MTEFQELVKDAPNFASMERGELAVYAYAMYTAGAKVDAENAKLKADAERMFQANVEKNNEVLELLGDNAKLRELLVEVLHELDKAEENVSHGWFWEAARELRVEVD